MMDMHVTLFLRCQLVSVTQLSGKAMLCLNKIVWMLNSTLCSSALQLRVRLSMLCSIALLCSGSAKDAYNFYLRALWNLTHMHFSKQPTHRKLAI